MDSLGQLRTMELLTFAEAAQLAKISVKTIYRHTLKGKIEVVETPLGKRIPRTALDPYLDTNGHSVGKDRTKMDNFGQSPGLSETVPDSSGQLVPVSVHLATLELTNRLLQQQDKLHQKLQQEERRRLALEYQLQQYQTAISEQADSLAQERACRLALEKAKVEQEHSLEKLKVDVANHSWGSRLKKFLLRRVV